jgi:aspartyl-tRNA synthetase
MHSIRNYFNEQEFIEVETPVFCKSTPEGARDYLVPSRVNPGKFYALPQSPQIFKQLLMVGGIERYFQIAKCFRDEDLRADRQPEFTQVDMEMSFVDEDDVISMTEGLLKKVFKEVKGIDIKLPIDRMKYVDAIKYYGSDKPDLRYDMKINDITDIFKNTEMDFIKNIINNNGIVNAIVAKKSVDEFSRKKIDELSSYLKELNNSSLIYLKFGDELSGSIAKNISDDELKELKKKLDIKKGDVAFIIVGDNYKKVKTAMGALRIKVANILNLVNDNE